MATPTLGAFAGLARGFERGYERGRQRVEDRRKEQRTDQLREFGLLVPKVLENAETTGDWAAAEDFIGNYFPATAKETAKRRGAKKAAAPGAAPVAGTVLAPAPPVAQPAGVASTDIAAVMQPGAPASPSQDATTSAPPLVPSRPAVTAGTPPPSPSPQQDFFGINMPTPAQKRQMEVDAEVGKLEQTRLAQVALARRILPSLQKDDSTITLEDAMRYVSKGELMSNAQQRGANVYRYGVDREALAKELFGVPFDKLDQAQAGIVIREEQLMLKAEAEQRALGTGQGKFQSPMTAKEAQDVGATVGTSSKDLAGQRVATDQERTRRASVEELKQSVEYIRDNLLGVLPKKGEFGGNVAPGAIYSARKRGLDPRMPDSREKVAALEARINNIVNVIARSVGEQRGTQTERDALRAEAALLQIRDALLTGDTQESANARIEQTLLILDGILSRLPGAPVANPRGQPAGGQTAPGGTTTPPVGATAAPTGKSNAVKEGNTWVIRPAAPAATTGQP